MMNDIEKNTLHAAYLLEELRTLMAQQLQMSARIYDQLAGDNAEQAWKAATGDIAESTERLDKLLARLEKDDEDVEPSSIPDTAGPALISHSG